MNPGKDLRERLIEAHVNRARPTTGNNNNCCDSEAAGNKKERSLTRSSCTIALSNYQIRETIITSLLSVIAHV